jgi:hypothetical protein
MGFTDQSHENIFRAVCGPWAIMSIHVLPKGFRHFGLFARSHRAETIHNIQARHNIPPATPAGFVLPCSCRPHSKKHQFRAGK